MAFLDWFGALGWRVYLCLFGAIVAAGLVGAWLGFREAEAALLTGQQPTRRRLREGLARLIALLRLLGERPGDLEVLTEAHAEIGYLVREVGDLLPPPRPLPPTAAPRSCRPERGDVPPWRPL